MTRISKNLKELLELLHVASGGESPLEIPQMRFQQFLKF